MLHDFLIWGVLLVGLVLLVVDKRSRIGALTLTYFLGLSLGHVPGVLCYLDPDIFEADSEVTKVGFDVTLVGMTAFIAGAIAARIFHRRITRVQGHEQTVSADIFGRSGWRILIIGIVSYFVVLPISALVPSLTAATSVMGTLLILGFWLQLYSAVGAKDSRKILLVLGTVPLLPLATLATGGFIGFGTGWALGIASFLFVIVRRRIGFYLAAPLVIFLGLSLFVTYFQQRNDIRNVVWDESTSMMQRLDRISTLVTDFQLLDLSNEHHRLALVQRLNQNYLVGVGVMRHREGRAALLYGATVPLWALIPRAIWPDKPAVGGGGGLVEKFTGLQFAEGTSVAAGQVLEFYANFGMLGVLAGFAIVGFILMRMDQAAMRALAIRNIGGVVQTILPGLVLVQSGGGNLVETLVATTSAVILSRLLVHSKLLVSRPTQKPHAKMLAQTMRGIGRP
jgi:hypothetical protein